MRQRVQALLFLLLAAVGSVWGQSRSCGTMDYVQKLERERPNLREQLRQQARQAGYTQKAPWEKKVLGGVITIPVVVHVVYNTSSQNISDAQVQSQIEALTRDFRKLNPDAANTPAAFKSLAADTEIEFVLAQRTPDGEPTTGITRTATTMTNFRTDDAMKFKASGGANAWDASRYLNIWVVRFASVENVLGYAQFPNSGPAVTDGVVIDYRYFGTTGTAVRPFNLGRTATHEVGHWLNLFHIWGDASCGDDQVADTPTQEAENEGCPTFPSPSCANTSDMFMNYMDYTDDACMNLFTTGQKNVMQTALTKYRPGIITSLGAVPVQVPELDAALVEVTAPGKVLCAATFTPTVVLRNRGNQPLTSVQIQFKLDNGPGQTYNWSGSLGSFQSVPVSLPAVTVAAGAHTISYAITSRNNASTDGDASNDTLSAAFQVQGLALPLAESFESPVFPAAGWGVHNPDYDLTWARTTKAAKTGTAAAYMQNIAYRANGLIDELVLLPLDLSSRTSPTLTFQVAYSLLSETGYSDTLEVLVSTDCGATFQRVYQKYDRQLVTATPAFTDKEFIPTAAQWRQETVDLSTYGAAKTVIINFRHITDFENNLYLDDVKVDGVPLGTQEEELAQRAIMITPNPTHGPVLITSPEAHITRLEVTDALGKVVQRQETPGHVKGKALEISLQNQANGLYFIKLFTDKGVVIRRVVKLR